MPSQNDVNVTVGCGAVIVLIFLAVVIVTVAAGFAVDIFRAITAQ